MKIEGARMYRCDQCGKIGAWGETWRCYSSILLEENFALEIPTVCSEKCQADFQKKIDSGEVRLPELKHHHYGLFYIRKERMGY